MMLKIVTVINWIVIAVLGYLVLLETLTPTKGGDAAGRGMGQAIYYLAIIALVVLVILNLLPYKQTKYAAFILILLPFALIKLDTVWIKVKNRMNQKPPGYNQDGTPWFKDEQKQRMALAIANGEVEKLKRMLQEPPPGLHTAGEEEATLLEVAVSEATYTSYREQEKVECVRLLFAAGARINRRDTLQNPIHYAAATTGNAELVNLLLDHGADPNARDVHFKRPAMFEAITAYKQPLETVRALLDAGADPNTVYIDVDKTPCSALVHAAKNYRWSICLLLIEKGADIRYQMPDGTSLKTMVDQADQYYQGDGYSTREDFERVKKIAQ